MKLKDLLTVLTIPVRAIGLYLFEDPKGTRPSCGCCEYWEDE